MVSMCGASLEQGFVKGCVHLIKEHVPHDLATAARLRDRQSHAHFEENSLNSSIKRLHQRGLCQGCNEFACVELSVTLIVGQITASLSISLQASDEKVC